MLEALPVEVIEQIFLCSLNLNFPRASPALAAALSREHIYRLLIILAFWDDPPNTNPGSEAIDRILAPLDYVPLTLDQRHKLQEAVLRCQWCTMERVRENIPNMIILTIHRQWINAGMIMEPDQRAALERFMKRQDDSVRVFHGKGKPLRRTAELMNHPEMRRLANLPGLHEYELHITPMALVEIRSRTMKTIVSWPALQLHSFPPHLLRGRSDGFTPDDVAFLEMLRMTSHNYTPVDSPLLPSTTTIVDRTALHEGVSNAIRTQNYNALISLLKIDEFVFRYNVTTRGRPVFYTFPSDHFLTVTRVGRNKPHLNQAFFEALLRASAESLPANSQEVLKWTLDNVRLAQRDPSTYNQINGRFARWLSDFILRLPEQIDYAVYYPEGQLFCCGQLDILDLEGGRFLEEVLEPFREPLENWMTQSSFRTEDHWLKKLGPVPPPNFPARS